MKTSKVKMKVTMQEWFYLGCLAPGGTLGIVGISIIGSKPPTPDHRSQLLEAPDVVPWYTLTKVNFVQRDGKPALQFGDGIRRFLHSGLRLLGRVVARKGSSLLRGINPSAPGGRSRGSGTR
jgi:hypothetical protein